MKNLNKILALVIVLAMAFSTVAFAGTFSDVADTDSYAEAVEVLAALGLLNGYEDGSFGPEKTITRAEFAAVIIRALGLEDAATGAFGYSFDDVPANEWYAGYVMMAAQKGIINGYGDGTFKPAKDVKFEEAVKMIVCALGYQKKFETVADAYPTAYVAQAHTLGLTMGANQAIGTDASRGIVARLVYNSLDVGKMDQVEYGTDNQWAETDRTILSENLNVAKVEGTVDSVSFANEGVNKLTYNYSKIAMQFDPSYTTYYFPNPKLTATTIEYADTVKPIKHYKTVGYVDMNDEANPVMVALVEKPGANETATITATQAEKGVFTADSKIEYYKNNWEEDSTKSEYKLASGVKIFSNDNHGEETDANFKKKYEAGYYPVVTLINNDNKAGYDVIYATEYYSAVVDEINDRIYRITFDEKSDYTAYGINAPAAITLNPAKETETYTIYDENGAVIDFADIKVGDVLNVKVSNDGLGNTYSEVVVTTTKLEGTITDDLGNSRYEIDGEEHYSFATLQAGDKGVLSVDMYGKVLKFELSEDSNRNFAVLYGLYVDDNGIDKEPRAILYTANGEFIDAGFAKYVNINAADLSAAGKDAYKTIEIANASEGLDLTVAADKVDFTKIGGKNQKIVMYTLNDAGDISEFYWAGGIAKRDENYKVTGKKTGTYSEKSSKIDGVVLPEDLALVTLVDGDYQSTLKKSNFSTNAISVLVDDETKYTIDAIEDKRSEEAVFAVAFNIKAKVAADSDVMFVTNVTKATDSEGGAAIRVSGNVNGVKTSVIVPADTVMYAQNNITVSGKPSDIKIGCVIQYNGDKEADAVRMLLTDTQINAIASAASAGTDVLKGDGTTAQGTGDAENDKIGHIYAGQLAEYKSGTATFKSGTELTVSSSAPTMLVYGATVSSSTIRLNDYIVFGVAETDKFSYNDPADNDDVVIVYSFDGEAIATIVCDVKADDTWN